MLKRVAFRRLSAAAMCAALAACSSDTQTNGAAGGDGTTASAGSASSSSHGGASTANSASMGGQVDGSSGGNAPSAGGAVVGGSSGIGGDLGGAVNAETGGRAHGGAAGAAGMGATAGSAGSAPAAANSAFGQCRFHFGTLDFQAKTNAKIIPELDFFTPGWLGQSDKFDMGAVCGEGDKAFANAVPVLVSYIIAFTARRDAKLQDCDVSGTNNLCKAGATFIRGHRDRILAQYKMYAQGFAASCGTKRTIIWEMEPDFYQYSTGGDPQALTATEAGALMTDLIKTVRQYLPNALFSLDISPWIPNNGRDWYSHFDLSLVSFISTSGGRTSANSAKIRSTDGMTWAGVHQVTGKPILADTGYGVGNTFTGHDPQWDDVNNINARIADGVIGVSQYNPKVDWPTTLQQARSKVPLPGCK